MDQAPTIRQSIELKEALYQESLLPRISISLLKHDSSRGILPIETSPVLVELHLPNHLHIWCFSGIATPFLRVEMLSRRERLRFRWLLKKGVPSFINDTPLG